jgi:prepilin-type N-terminal cleavage/methylation domain-containing protein
MRRKTGFTLVEVMLAVAAFGVVMLMLAGLLSLVISSQMRNRAGREVDEAGASAMARILQTIRNAQSVTSPGNGSSAATIGLIVDNAMASPTVFDSSNGTIRIIEGSTAPAAITSSRVHLDSLMFYNYGQLGTPGLIRVDFVLSYLNPSNRPEYTVSKHFYGSATIH